jgi:transposase
MTEIQEVLYQYYKGISIKQITQSLGMARNTVREIIRLAQGFGLKAKQGAESELEHLAEQVRQARHRPCMIEGTIQALLGTYHEQLKAWWKSPYMTATQMTRLLGETHQVTVNDRSMRRYVARHFKEVDAPKATVHLETPPGNQGQVDFGYAGMMKDPISQKMRRAYAFVLTLSYSRHRFVRFVFRQDVQTWIDCHIRAFHFFGGAPKTLILDNLKAGVLSPDIYDPTLNRSYAELERHYGFVADPAKVRTPQHKGKVERSVTIVRQQVLAGRTFKDSEEANAYALQWSRHEIAHRVTRTTGQTPWERFEQAEKASLVPLPLEDYEYSLWQEGKVHHDHHIVFQGSFYSVPSDYIGETVWIRATQRLVEVFLEAKRIKLHVRTYEKGQWVTDKADYPEGARIFLSKDADTCLQEAQAIGSSAHAFLSQILKRPTLVSQRKAQAILRLADAYGKQRLEAACERSLAFDNLSYRSLKRILVQALDQKSRHEEEKKTLARCSLRESSYLRHPQEFVPLSQEACL